MGPHAEQTHTEPLRLLEAGWAVLLAARALGPGAIHTDTVDGREVVVWRSATGRLSALDAYCPHRGAFLGLGGRVEGEALRCPLHGQRFAADGSALAADCPGGVRLQAWEVQVLGGQIWVRPPSRAGGERPPAPDAPRGLLPLLQQVLAGRGRKPGAGA